MYMLKEKVKEEMCLCDVKYVRATWKMQPVGQKKLESQEWGNVRRQRFWGTNKAGAGFPCGILPDHLGFVKCFQVWVPLIRPCKVQRKII